MKFPGDIPFFHAFVLVVPNTLWGILLRRNKPSRTPLTVLQCNRKQERIVANACSAAARGPLRNSHLIAGSIRYVTFAVEPQTASVRVENHDGVEEGVVAALEEAHRQYLYCQYQYRSQY